MKNLFALSAVILTISCMTLCSCGKKNISTSTSLVNADPDKVQKVKPSWYSAEKKVCILFGYGYNDKDFVENTVKFLGEKYGIESDTVQSGMLLPLVFPDDFRSGSDARISRLSSKLEDVNIAGIITIGAPDNTNAVLARIEESWDNLIPYPVYSFFPQDDVTGIEATSNFVIDRALEGTGVSDAEGSEEVQQTQAAGIEGMLDRSIELMLLSGAPLPHDLELLTHVKAIVGSAYEVTRYIDPESGLQSINHFVIEAQ